MPTYTNPIADTSVQVNRIPVPVILCDVNGNGIALNAAGALPIASQAAASVSGTLQNAATATGNGTPLPVLGLSSVAATVTGITTATITWEATEDNTNWSSVNAVQSGTNTIGTTATANGDYVLSCAGFQQVRARISAYTSGTITVTAHAVPSQNEPRVVNANIVAGSAVIGSTTIQATSGTALTADQTNSILKTSLYGKNTAAADTNVSVDSGGAVRVSLQGNQTPVTGSAAVAANTSNSAALPAVASKTNYVTGFSVTTQGGTGAAAGAVTLTGVITGTMTFEAGAAANNPVQMFVTFPAPIPASAVNTAITVNVPTLGANTGAAACTIYGFVQ